MGVDATSRAATKPSSAA
ncbi:hypothetical protein F6B93_00825 [Mycobacterium spongiae]|uniref:Uncharacterized protein n=1 Tax=Mycobacterium spongiae TaxID=886343 RepID=A0A975K189_9MYCO|nr:hypothetical protein F6B93_00825 [Mycobacterium spongiae]